MSSTYQLEKIVGTEDDFDIELSDSYVVFILTGAAFYGINAFLQRYENQKASANDIDPWRWRKIVVSWIHGFIIGVWSFVGLLCYPELLDDPLLFVNTSSYMLILVSTGYFFYDALDIIVNSRIQEKMGVFLHHVVVIAAFGYILHVKLCVGYSQITLLAEFNSIFLHGRKLLRMANFGFDTSLYRIFSYLNILTFFVFRIIPFSYCLYGCFADRHRSYAFIFYLLTSVNIVVDVVNVVLFWRIIQSDLIKPYLKKKH
ncbi:TLC domain-containing protein 2-like [Mytilus californianus]|uniref:TLC domain-containing protein 2-like n=1 Tax=Mytilus californianus TaxID=6549 RepID=UPI0022463F53|nr:TLC domain-containing protein 2-like [Mytilus californianus]